MKIAIATIERKLNRIIHFLKINYYKQDKIQETNFFLLSNFPLCTVEQIDNFNNQLEDVNVWRQFVNILLLFTN